MFALVAKTRHSPTLAEVINCSSRVNYRCLSTPEKVKRLRGLSQKNRELQKKVQRLQLKFDKLLETSSISLDDETSQDFEKIMEEEDHNINTQLPEDSFQAIFWKNQRELLSKKGKEKKETDGIHLWFVITRTRHMMLFESLGASHFLPSVHYAII